jgi:hypothetical protein
MPIYRNGLKRLDACAGAWLSSNSEYDRYDGYSRPPQTLHLHIATGSHRNCLLLERLSPDVAHDRPEKYALAGWNNTLRARYLLLESHG